MREPLDELDREVMGGLKGLWGVPQRLLTGLLGRVEAGLAWVITLIIGGRP